MSAINACSYVCYKSTQQSLLQEYTVMSVLTRFDTKCCFRHEDCFKCRTHIQLQKLSIQYCFLALTFKSFITIKKKIFKHFFVQ